MYWRYFLGVSYQWELLDVLEVLVKCTGWGGTKERFRRAGTKLRHTNNPVFLVALCEEGGPTAENPR
jgi:hypothetical protein